jgi:hypothetical protein
MLYIRYFKKTSCEQIGVVMIHMEKKTEIGNLTGLFLYGGRGGNNKPALMTR